jgi:hypothetical protein
VLLTPDAIKSAHSPASRAAGHQCARPSGGRPCRPQTGFAEGCFQLGHGRHPPAPSLPRAPRGQRRDAFPTPPAPLATHLQQADEVGTSAERDRPQRAGTDAQNWLIRARRTTEPTSPLAGSYSAGRMWIVLPSLLVRLRPICVERPAPSLRRCSPIVMSSGRPQPQQHPEACACTSYMTVRVVLGAIYTDMRR